MRLLATGTSARALAASAARAGWAPVVLDAFGDRDCPGEVHRCTPFTARRAAAHARTLAADAVAIAAQWEHAPRRAAALGEGRRSLVAPAGAIAWLRDPLRVARALRAAGLPSLVTAAQGRSSPPVRRLRGPAAATVRAWLHAEPGVASAGDRADDWVAADKPRQGGGGRGIVAFSGSAAPRTGRYLQEWRRGTPASLVVCGDGRRGVPLVLTRQLIGDAAFGASGTTYSGSLVAAGSAALPGLPAVGGDVAETLARLADVLVRGSGATGLLGVDGIMDAEDRFWVVEVNPRWCASFELLDALLPVPLFGWHAAAFAGRLPPAWPLADAPAAVAAKGVLYRDASVAADHAPDTSGWPDDPALADIPWTGVALPPGAPICTVRSVAPDATAARAALDAAAARVRAALRGC